MTYPQHQPQGRPQAKALGRYPGRTDPRVIATNRLNKARPISANLMAKSTPAQPTHNVSTNQTTDVNHADNTTKPDILQAENEEAPQPLPFDAETRAEAIEDNKQNLAAEALARSETAAAPVAGAVTPLQRKALSSLLKGISVPDTAVLCGVDEWTLRAWLEIPEVDKLYRTGRQQNFDFLHSLILEVARDAMATLVRLSQSDNLSIQTRAAKAIVQLSKPTSAGSQKAQVEAEVAKARQEDTIAELNNVKAALTASAKNWEKIKTSLVHGTFRRPGWLPIESWQRIIRAGYDVSVAW